MSPNPRPLGLIHARKLDRYVGPHVVSAADVQAVSTPKPDGDWHPIEHWSFFKLIEKKLEVAGIGVVEALHSLYRRGDRYIGLAITDRAYEGREVVVGWFNAHDKSHAATLLLGEQVMVCFNLCLHGEIKVSRKHTRHIERDLPGLIGDAVGQVEDRVASHEERLAGYRGVPLRRGEGAKVLIDLLDAGAFAPSAFHKVLGEWRQPSIPAFAERWNVDRLYQAVTTQPTPLALMPRRHRALHRVLDGFCAVE